MKKTVNTLLKFALGTCLTSGLTVAAMAQTTAPANGEMRLKVTERNGNELREIERTYRTEGMTDQKRDAIVNKLINSLRATRKGKDSQISVTIEDERGTDRIRFNSRSNSNQDAIGRVYGTPPNSPRVYTLPREPRASIAPRSPRLPRSHVRLRPTYISGPVISHLTVNSRLTTIRWGVGQNVSGSTVGNLIRWRGI